MLKKLASFALPVLLIQAALFSTAEPLGQAEALRTDSQPTESKRVKPQNRKPQMPQSAQSPTSQLETAVLGGGCFWGVQDLIRKLPGVTHSEVGYAGGFSTHPKYEQVKTGTTGHAEVVHIVFDRSKLSYEKLLEYFFRLHDPTTRNRQGNDIGTQYRSVIFYENNEQKEIAETVKKRVDTSGKWKSSVVTEIVPRVPFYSAEEYHQDYLVKNPNGYTCHYLRD